MQKPVLHNQSLYDFAIQHCGTVAAVIAIAAANNLSTTAILTPGMELTIPSGVVNEPDIVEFYRIKKHRPATAIENNDLIIEPDGIDYMIVEDTFIIY